KPRSDRRKRVMALALGPLALTLDLPSPLGHVIDDAIAGDMLSSVRLGNLLGACPDHEGELDFPIRLDGVRGDFYRVIRSGYRTRRFQEDDRLGRDRQVGFRCV